MIHQVSLGLALLTIACLPDAPERPIIDPGPEIDADADTDADADSDTDADANLIYQEDFDEGWTLGQLVTGIDGWRCDLPSDGDCISKITDEESLSSPHSLSTEEARQEVGRVHQDFSSNFYIEMSIWDPGYQEGEEGTFVWVIGNRPDANTDITHQAGLGFGAEFGESCDPGFYCACSEVEDDCFSIVERQSGWKTFSMAFTYDSENQGNFDGCVSIGENPICRNLAFQGVLNNFWFDDTLKVMIDNISAYNTDP